MDIRARLLRPTFIASTGVALALAALSYWYTAGDCEGVACYKPSRDRAFIEKLFMDNWYWLIPEQTTFVLKRFLDKSASYSESAPLDKDASKIIVYCQEGKPLGFAAYNKESFYKGKLRFIAVEKQARGKGYSQKLMNYALNDLKAMGCSVVELLTRTDNAPAQKLYYNLGFKPLRKEEKFIWFEKVLDYAAIS